MGQKLGWEVGAVEDNYIKGLRGWLWIEIEGAGLGRCHIPQNPLSKFRANGVIFFFFCFYYKQQANCVSPVIVSIVVNFIVTQTLYF